MMERRVFILLAVFLAGATIIGRLFLLQVVSRDFYRALAKGQRQPSSAASFKRAEILFAGGEKLATRQTTTSLYASLPEIKPDSLPKDFARILAQTLDLKESDVSQALKGFEVYPLIKANLSPAEIQDVEDLKIIGLHLKEEERPFFPQTETAAAVTGFIDKDANGQYGLEGFYDETLRDPKVVSLVLSLDYSVQSMAEKLLKESQADLKFRSGQILVLDPKNGEILALATWPSFDPNHYGEERLAAFQNPVVQKIFEPGSVFKPLTMASAIQEGKVTPETTYVDEGVVKIGQIPIYNYANRKYGQQTMTQVLEKSINTGAVWAYQQLGSDLFLKHLEKFGFFQKTNVDLQGEVFSQNREFKKGYDINFATASFGQGIEITPVQLGQAFTALANNGQMVQPHLVREIVYSDASVRKTETGKTLDIISAKTARQVVTMMTSVVENGFGKKARVPGYYIAGKTGTAQVAWSALGENKSGYSDETVQSFLGFAPAFNPRFLILVKLDNPQAKTAEYSALPIFHDLAQYIIDLWQIPPDYE